MPAPPNVFKYCNIVLGSLTLLASLSQLSYIFYDFNAFIQAIFATVLSGLVVYLEFRVPTNLYKFASFYFNFLGRGILNFVLCSFLAHGSSMIKIFVCLFLFIGGFILIFANFIPIIEEPESFRINNAAIMVGDDEFDDDDDDVV